MLQLILNHIGLALIFNCIGLASGLIGTIIVFFYGMPSIKVLSGGGYVEMKITPRIQQFSNRSRFGLALIATGFLIQMVALFLK